MDVAVHFIKYHPLKERLRDPTLTEREALPYYVMLCVAAAFLGAFQYTKVLGLSFNQGMQELTKG